MYGIFRKLFLMLRATNINENFLKQVRTISFISDPRVNIDFVCKHYLIYFEYFCRLLMIVINDTTCFLKTKQLLCLMYKVITEHISCKSGCQNTVVYITSIYIVVQKCMYLQTDKNKLTLKSTAIPFSLLFLYTHSNLTK